MKARGITPANDLWTQQYKEPAPPDSTNLPELPKGWAWAFVAQLCSEVTYGRFAKCDDNKSGVPVLRTGNIDEGELNLNSLKYFCRHHDAFPSLMLQLGDLLFNRTKSAELFGKSAIPTS